MTSPASSASSALTPNPNPNPTQVMRHDKFCLFCGVAWETGHAAAAHWKKKEEFGVYATYVRSHAAPCLARLDGLRGRLEMREVPGEKEETANEPEPEA